MPDNQSRGMLETSLGNLVVPTDAPLWVFAQIVPPERAITVHPTLILIATRRIFILSWRGLILRVDLYTFR